MIYNTESKITQQLLDNSDLNDEYIFRQLYHRIIEDIPIHELRGLFISRKIDPFSKESEDKLTDIKTPGHIKKEILMLRNMEILKYKVTLTID